MSSPNSAKNALPERDPWIVFDYEVEMYLYTRHVLQHGIAGNEELWPVIRNALIESAVLHTRILVDILLSKKTDNDDIALKELLPGWPSSTEAASMENFLRETYGRRNQPNSPCWAFNKMLAHPTRQRTDRYDYDPVVSPLDAIIIPLLKHISTVAQRPNLSTLMSQVLPDERT